MLNEVKIVKKNKTPKTKSEKIIKALQIISAEFMTVMFVTCLVFIIKNDISVTNVDAITQYITGGTMAMAMILIVFTVLKAFALVFPPIVLYFVAGLLFEDIFTAVLVGFIGSALSLILPYYLGKFTGKEMLDTLKKKYKAVNKLDNFTDENTFAVVFAFKVGGLLPSDLSSLIFGAMNVPFGKYFIASNLGLLVLNISWSIIGAISDFTSIWTYVCIIPAGICLVGSFLFMRNAQKRKKITADTFIDDENIKNSDLDDEDETKLK